MRTALAISALFVVTLFAGCSSEPTRQEVDFGGVGQNQVAPDAGNAFELRVRVVGLAGDAANAAPIADAFVGVAHGSQAIAKTQTNADGVAFLTVKKDQTVTIVSKAVGWTVEDSGAVSIARASHTGRLCLEDAPCIVVNSDASPEFSLQGDRGTVSMVLFRSKVIQTLEIPVSPHGYAIVASPPDNQAWFPKPVLLSDDEALQKLYMLRLRDTDSTLEWTNGQFTQADFELAVGCQPETYDARTSGGNGQSYMTTQGPVKVSFKWDPDEKDGWSPCQTVYAGPWVNTLNTQVTTKVTTTLRFEGQSSILPVNA